MHERCYEKLDTCIVLLFEIGQSHSSIVSSTNNRTVRVSNFSSQCSRTSRIRDIGLHGEITHHAFMTVFLKGIYIYKDIEVIGSESASLVCQSQYCYLRFASHNTVIYGASHSYYYLRVQIFTDLENSGFSAY